MIQNTLHRRVNKTMSSITVCNSHCKAKTFDTFVSIIINARTMFTMHSTCPYTFHNLINIRLLNNSWANIGSYRNYKKNNITAQYLTIKRNGKSFFFQV